MYAFWMTNLPILRCFLGGLVLLVAEAYVPGFGIIGLTGMLLEGLAIVLVYLEYSGAAALGFTIVILVVMGFGVVLLLRSAAKGRISRSSMILNDAQKPEEGYTATQSKSDLVGKVGVTSTPLRPTGMAVVEGATLNVDSQGEYIPQGAPVRVESVEGLRVLVRAVPQSKA